MHIEHSTDSNGNVVLRIPRWLAVLVYDLCHAHSDELALVEVQKALGEELLPKTVKS